MIEFDILFLVFIVEFLMGIGSLLLNINIGITNLLLAIGLLNLLNKMSDSFLWG